MKGLPRRIRLRRRQSDPDPQETQPTIVAAPADAATAEALPAGLAPEDVAPSHLSFRDRGQLRRRLRYLRRVRELGFRDLGGLVFDLHRFGRRNDELVLGKLAALDAVDRELRAIERVLDERRDILELREPGIAACPRCGAVHGSDARYCPQCGTQFSGPLAMGDFGAAAPAPQPAHPTAAAAAPAPAQAIQPAEPAPHGYATPGLASTGSPLRDAAGTGPTPTPVTAAADRERPGTAAASAPPGDLGTTAADHDGSATPAADQPTIAMAPLDGPPDEAPAAADDEPDHQAPPVTSGDPLAPPDRRQA